MSRKTLVDRIVEKAIAKVTKKRNKEAAKTNTNRTLTLLSHTSKDNEAVDNEAVDNSLKPELNCSYMLGLDIDLYSSSRTSH